MRVSETSGMADQFLGGKQKHALIAACAGQPYKRYFRETFGERDVAVANFGDKHATRLQVRGSVRKYLQNGIESLLAGCKREGRFVPILVGKCGHVSGLHVRRVGEYEVVALAGESLKQIGLHEMHARTETMPFDVDLRDRERIGREVRTIHLRLREGDGGRNGDAAAASTQIENAVHTRGIDPWLKLLGDEVADE